MAQTPDTTARDERRSPGPTSDLSFGERFYLREAIKGMGVIARHFWRNLFGYRDPNPEVLDRRGAGVNLGHDHQLSRGAQGVPAGLTRDAPPGAAPRRTHPLRRLLHVRHRVPGPVHLHRGGRVRRPGHREVPVRFEIDELRCIVCGFCVEACPKDAIRMDTGTHAPSVLSRPLAVFDKEALLKGPAVEHPSDVLTYRVPLRMVAPPDEDRGSSE